MTGYSIVSPKARRAIWILALVVGSVLFTFGFACAVPFAALAAISAMTLGRRDALATTGAIWLANQAMGFAFLRYPTDSETLAWGAALGLVALLSCETAGFVMRRLAGVVGASVAFLAAFVAYEGSIILIDVAIGYRGVALAPETIARIFLINVSAFGVLWALHEATSALGLTRKLRVELAPRHI
jgi:hypothetical protein